MSLLEKHVFYSIQAGICASGGSVFGKLSTVQLSCIDNIIVQYLFSAVLIGLMVISNAAVWTFFVKALQETNSSFVPTLSVAATNYIISAIVGWCIFGETLSAMWCLGTVLILAGLILLASDSQQIETEKTE